MSKVPTINPGPGDSDRMPQDATETLPIISVADARQPHASLDNATDISDEEAYAKLKAKRAERRRKKLIRRGIAAGVVVAIALIAIIATLVINAQPAGTNGPVTDMVTEGTFTTTVEAKGQLKPISASVVSPSVDGTVASINVQAGQAVNEGDVLMTIKNDELDRNVTEAQRAVAAAQEEARKQADATAAQAARAEAVQKAYAAAQKKYQNETLPAYQTQLNTLADEMNQAQTTYNQTETDYQMAFQTWSSEQSDENAAALDVAESARNDAQIAYQNAKSAYEDYKTQKPAAPAMNDVNSEIISDGNTADSIFSDSAETVTNNGSDTTVTADTSALEAELEKASNTLAELQSRLSSQQAVAESDPSAVTAEEKEKMEITNNLSELDQMSAQELVEAAKKGIKADFNGVITKVSVVEGATTALGTELFTLQNTDKINVNVNVSKYDYDKLKEGQSADITLAGKTYEGEVTSISHVATQNEKGASLISADVRIKNPDDDIFLGVDAKVTIHAEEADDVVVLPSEVVNIGKDGSFCYVIENGVITRRDITTGISSDDYVEVTEGIKEGDEVIRDLGSLEEGMQAEATLSESADNGSQSNLTDAEEGD